MKEINEKASFLDMPNGMDAKSREKYTQEFVRAPMSLHPPKHKGRDLGNTQEAMRITMGK